MVVETFDCQVFVMRVEVRIDRSIKTSIVPSLVLDVGIASIVSERGGVWGVVGCGGRELRSRRRGM